MPRSPIAPSEEPIRLDLDTAVLSALKMRQLENQALQAGMPSAGLMEQAIQGCAAWIKAQFPAANYPRVIVLGGPGKNGGDGCGIARCLQLSGYSVYLALVGEPDRVDDLNAHQRSFAIQTGVTELPPNVDSQKLAALCESADLIIDALLGTGFTGTLRSPLADLIRTINLQLQLKGRHLRSLQTDGLDLGQWKLPKVLSIDLPSGLEPDGTAEREKVIAIKADFTLCLGAWKPVFFDDVYSEFYGTVKLIPLGLPPVSLSETRARLIDRSQALRLLKTLRGSEYDHKYSRGHAAIRAGSLDYPGAAMLALAGVLSVRPGYIEWIRDSSDAFASDFPFCTLPSVVRRGQEFFESHWPGSSESRPKAFLIGPGCTKFSPLESSFVRDWKGPIVIDAGALRDKGMASLWPHPESASLLAPRILTPHRGEFDYLWNLLSERKNPAESGRQSLNLLERAQLFSNSYGVHLVLKGSTTIIASPQLHLRVLHSPEPVLAHAGTGDVLSGILTGLLARGLSAEVAMCAAVVAHSTAASDLHLTDWTTGQIPLDVPLALAARVVSLIGRPDVPS